MIAVLQGQMVSHMLTIAPKTFFYLTIAYTVLVVILGIWLAEPYLIFIAFFILLLANVVSWRYLKPPIPPSATYYFWAIPIIAIMFFYAVGDIVNDKVVENKTQLEQVVGTIPAIHTEVKKRRSSSTYVNIGDVAIHCSFSIYDDCEKIFQYKGQTATVWYQPNTSKGNIAYEIQVNNQPIYEFNQQKALLMQYKSKKTRQWIWTFILLGFPPLIMGWLDRQVRKSLPKMTHEEFENAKKQILAQHEPVTGIRKFSGLVFALMSVCSLFYGAVVFTNPSIMSFLVWIATTITSFYLTYVCATKKRKA